MIDRELRNKLEQHLEDEHRRLTDEITAIQEAKMTDGGVPAVSYPRFEEGEGESVTHMPADEEADESEEYAVRQETARVLNERRDEVIAALHRIEQGTYGICKTCGKPIDAARLGANPAAEFDIEHTE
ncbi:MAG: TraR/DksA C4-type zinc finger protein [bacterium]|nr:TraR/DksA C4-type zinc finger protein [bacterium]MDZ4299285.1 TraR/DksA C4-type zinc finger protein [Candidatus Sungbacteria bacterium]